MAIESDAEGYRKVSKVFPCDCGSEGLCVEVREDIDLKDGSLEVDISFFKHEPKYSKIGRMDWLSRFWCVWAALKGQPWTAMVTMRENIAIEFATHILFHLDRETKDVTNTE